MEKIGIVFLLLFGTCGEGQECVPVHSKTHYYHKNNFPKSGEGPTDDINEKMFSINFTNSKIKLCSNLHYSCNKNICMLTKHRLAYLKMLIINLFIYFLFRGSIKKKFQKIK